MCNIYESHIGSLSIVVVKKILLPLLAFALVYNIAGFFINSNGYGTKMKLYDLIVTAATVGIFEESGFR